MIRVSPAHPTSTPQIGKLFIEVFSILFIYLFDFLYSVNTKKKNIDYAIKVMLTCAIKGSIMYINVKLLTLLFV